MQNNFALDQKVKSYILDCIDGSGYDVKLDTIESKIAFLKKTYNSEYGHGYNMAHYGSHVKCIESYLKGLPSCCSVAFTYPDIERLGLEWGVIYISSTETEKEQWLDDYWPLLASKIAQLFKRINVPNNNYSGQ